MLTDQDTKNITESWEYFAGNELNSMLKFYSTLFKWYPHVRYHFPDDLTPLAEKLNKTLGILVDNLYRWEDLVPELHRLGRYHRKLGIANEDYVGVVKALIYTIKEAMGNNYREEIGDSWKKALVAVSRTMMNAPAKSENNVFRFFKKVFG